MLNSILDKINNGVAFEASKTPKAKIAWKNKKKTCEKSSKFLLSEYNRHNQNCLKNTMRKSSLNL